MHADALAHIYAKSLYELAEEAGGLDKIAEVGAELEQICTLARQQPSFAEFLASPIIDVRRRDEAIGRIFRDRITDLTHRFLLVLNHKRRLDHLQEINAAYDELFQEAQGRIEVDVFTPSPLDKRQLRDIEQRIGDTFRKQPVVHAHVDETMLGGLKLRLGDQLIDGSVAARLRRLKHRFMTSGASAIRDRFHHILQEGEAS